MTYSSQAIIDYKKTIAHNAIQMELQCGEPGWTGDATTGFDLGGLMPYPIGSRNTTLPPVDGPTGTVQYFILGPTMNTWGGGATYPGARLPEGNLFPPGSTTVDQGEVEGFPGWIVQCDPWVSLYQPWIERIEGILEGWDALPEFNRFNEESQKAFTAIQHLTPKNGFETTAGPWQPDFNNTDVNTAVDLLDQYVGSGTSGFAIYAFRKSYGPERIKDTMESQSKIAFGAAMTLGGEYLLWQKASEDIMRLCEQARNAFHYQPPSFDFTIDFKVVQAFLNLVGTVVPPPYGTAIKVGAAAAGLISVLVPEDVEPEPAPAPLTADTADQVAENFREAVWVLRRACFNQEEELVRKTKLLKESIAGAEPNNVHINPIAGVDPDLTSAEQINMNLREVRDIGNVQVPIIASTYASAAHTLYGAAPSPIWDRDVALGYGAAGARDLCHEILTVFDQVATGTARELVDAGQLLAKAAGDFELTDGNQAMAMNGLKEDVDRGNTGWQPPTLPPPPPPHRPGVPYPV